MEPRLCIAPGKKVVRYDSLSVGNLHYYMNSEETTVIDYWIANNGIIYLQIHHLVQCSVEQGQALLPDCMEIRHFLMTSELFFEAINKSGDPISWEKEGF